MEFNRDPQLKNYYPQDYILKYTIIPLVYKFVTPNQLTMLRYILVPIVFVILFLENYTIGVPLFIFAAFTDLLDGSLARVKDKITPWGILNDPIADKLLIISVSLLFVIRYLHWLLALVIVFTEVSIFLLGFLLSKNKKIGAIPSNIFGKLKFTLEFFGLTSLIIGVWENYEILKTISIYFFVIAIALAVISAFVTYKKYSQTES